MKGVNGEQALLAILLLLLTSLATVSGSMPVVESIETFFEEPMHTTHSKEKYVSENFDAGGPTAGGAEVNFGDTDEDEDEDEDEFKQKHEKFANCNTQEDSFTRHGDKQDKQDEHFANCANRNEGFLQSGVPVSETRSQKMIIEPFQGSLYSKF